MAHGQSGVSPEIAGVALSTVLLVLIDMKCQQFVVRSQSPSIAWWSCIFSGWIFIALAFLPTAIVSAAQQGQILPAEVTGKTAIPYILSWLGGDVQTPWGLLFVASLALPALGIGSNILRIQTKANLDIVNLDSTPGYRAGFAFMNATLALAIALRGGEIVGLIVSFYAAYLSAVWIPFAAYLFEQAQLFVFSVTSVQVSLLIGGLAALITLGTSLFQPAFIWFNSPELTILGVGIGLSSLALFITQAGETLLLLFKRTQEDIEA